MLTFLVKLIASLAQSVLRSMAFLILLATGAGTRCVAADLVGAGGYGLPGSDIYGLRHDALAIMWTVPFASAIRCIA